MIRAFLFALAASLFALPALAAPVLMPQPGLMPRETAPLTVQSCEPECGCEGSECEPPEPKRIFDAAKGTTEDSDGTTGRDIELLLARGSEACGGYDITWRFDCLSVELERVAATLPKAPAYDRARAEITEAAAKLHAIAVRNADPARPPVRRKATVGDGAVVRTRRPITPVAPARVAAATVEAEAVLDELSTTLLRSAPTRTAQVELARVARAVDSTKVLLRSG